jgi:hypothetical protein
MARHADCTCEIGRFTCGHCLRNAPAWHYTPSTPAEIAERQAREAYQIYEETGDERLRTVL